VQRRRCGVDFLMFRTTAPMLEPTRRLPARQVRSICLACPEPEAVRHYTRLSRQNYAIDLAVPARIVMMKHNPRLDEKAYRKYAWLC
jgi:glycine dehydrogenase subunit 2